MVAGEWLTFRTFKVEGQLDTMGRFKVHKQTQSYCGVRKGRAGVFLSYEFVDRGEGGSSIGMEEFEISERIYPFCRHWGEIDNGVCSNAMN